MLPRFSDYGPIPRGAVIHLSHFALGQVNGTNGHLEVGFLSLTFGQNQ